ncbi:MAG: hypothetical protein R3A47_12130, partial [Polyangiales bacterium]
LHPDIIDRLDNHAVTYAADLNVEAIDQVLAKRGVPQATALPKFPAVLRDLAIEIDKKFMMDAVANAIFGVQRDRIESVQPFDLYEGDQVAAGKRSLGLRIVYRDPEATLTDAEVDKIHQAVVDAVRRTFDATPR